MARRSTEEQLAHDFSLLDTDGKGFINAADLQRIAKTIPTASSCSDADIQSILQLLSRGAAEPAKPSKNITLAARITLEQFSAAVGGL